MARLNGRGNRKRDFQRSKVYRSERDLSAGLGEYGGRVETIPEIQKWINQIVASRWMKGYLSRQRNRGRKHAIGHPGKSVRVTDGRGRRTACAQLNGNQTAEIKMPKWSRSKLVILHELTHVYTNWRYPAWHGRQFCANYLEFVKRWIGKEAHSELKASFDRNKVKYRRV